MLHNLHTFAVDFVSYLLCEIQTWIDHPAGNAAHILVLLMDKFWVHYSRMQRIREGIHIRTMKAKRKVEEISKEDVQAFLKKNAFVLFTVGAVVVGVYASAS